MLDEKESIFVFGASGHAKVVIDAIEKQGAFKIAFLIDDNKALWGQDFYGYPVYGGRETLVAESQEILTDRGIVAIGENNIRLKVAEWLVKNGFKLVSVIHPSVQIARGVKVGRGSVIMAGCIINSDAVIGENAIINTAATVDHDCAVGNGVHIAPGSHLCGNVQVGEGSLIGAASVITPGISIGNGVVVGAGSTVIKNVNENEKVVGSPARIVK
ncbi:acetyltransferase [Sulfurirhabdus autotrophica]|nr:acetyltransferase [Sulfurirhabdus autotrophica]